MNESFIEQLKDYFEPCELVELFADEIKMEDVVYSFEDVIANNEDMLKDYMEHGR